MTDRTFNRSKAKRICANAVAEILDYELVNAKEIKEIIHIYRWIPKVVPYTPVDGPMGEFHKIYAALKKLNHYLEETTNAKAANLEYKMIRHKTERNIIEWLLKYEQLGRFLSKMYIDTFIGDRDFLSNGYEKLCPEFSLKVGLYDFYSLIDFVELFSSHYDKLIEKYHNPLGDGTYYHNNVEYYESKQTTLLDYIAPALKMPIEDVFKNHKEPFEVKRLKHLVPFKAYHRTSPSPQLQKAHDLFHQDQFEEAIVLYRELLITRNDLEEAKAGLAISYFITENYELAEATAATLNQYEYRELINLITKFKSGLETGGLSDSKSYEIADTFCLEALEIEAETRDRDGWLKEYEDLYKSVSIAPKGLPSIANCNFKGSKYPNIFHFHNRYVQRKFEQTILDKMSHRDAVEYFITKMDIVGLDLILDYREYADVNKEIFLEKLLAVFEIFKSKGNERLTTTSGVCKGCQHGHTGTSFIGEIDDTYMELLILTENDRVVDIFECNYFAYDSFDKEFLGKRLSLRIETEMDEDDDNDDDIPF